MEQRLIDANKLTYEDMEDGYGNICLVDWWNTPYKIESEENNV